MSGDAGVTSPAVERAVAALLGAGDDTARAAVAALAAAERLGDGIALHAMLHAARRGTDAAGALDGLAAGERLASSWSDYERRVAVEEAADEVRLPAAGAGDERRVVAAEDERRVVAAGEDAPLEVLRALAGGATAVVAGAQSAVAADGLAPARARCDHAFVAELARHCGARVIARTDQPAAPRGNDAPTVDETVRRSESYIDVLSTR